MCYRVLVALTTWRLLGVIVCVRGDVMWCQRVRESVLEGVLCYRVCDGVSERAWEKVCERVWERVVVAWTTGPFIHQFSEEQHDINVQMTACASQIYV